MPRAPRGLCSSTTSAGPVQAPGRHRQQRTEVPALELGLAPDLDPQPRAAAFGGDHPREALGRFLVRGQVHPPARGQHGAARRLHGRGQTGHAAGDVAPGEQVDARERAGVRLLLEAVEAVVREKGPLGQCRRQARRGQPGRRRVRHSHARAGQPQLDAALDAAAGGLTQRLGIQSGVRSEPQQDHALGAAEPGAVEQDLLALPCRETPDGRAPRPRGLPGRGAVEGAVFANGHDQGREFSGGRVEGDDS